MANLKKKLGAGLAALALMVGAMPSTALAFEDPKGGQHFDKGRPKPYVVALVLAGLVGLAFLVVGKQSPDRPASP